MKAVIHTPSKADQQKAAASMKVIRGQDGKFRPADVVSITIKGSTPAASVPVEVPFAVLEHIEFLLSSMAEGKAVEIKTVDELLSTQQVADRLNVSRPFVIKLLEEGKIPFEKVGTHRRVKLEDLNIYEKAQQAIRNKQLDFLAQQAQELNLGYE